MRVKASYYRQFDADFNLDVPGEGYGGWNEAQIELPLKHTAMVIMHAWDMGTREEYPGWHRAVEYIPRAYEICRAVFPRLLGAVRASDMTLFHVVGGGNYYKDCPGYKMAVELAGPEPPRLERIQPDAQTQELWQFRSENVFVGKHNEGDVARGFADLDFPAEAKPLPHEGVAENGHQLYALCKNIGISHLIYAGFAINWCLLMSAGGMADMSSRGLMCSAIREAVTAVENKETARRELCKEVGLWRVALAMGFVFGVDDFITAFLNNAGGCNHRDSESSKNSCYG